MALIRPETDADIDAVRQVHLQAFGREAEALVVEELRHKMAAILSLVALRRNHVVGHALFSRVVITNGVGWDRGVGLAPIAVAPEHQRTGVGTDLIRHGIAALKNRRHGVLVVLGDPAYYTRFGFQPAARYGLRCSIPCPPEAFLVLPLNADWCCGGGLVRYAPQFDGI